MDGLDGGADRRLPVDPLSSYPAGEAATCRRNTASVPDTPARSSTVPHLVATITLADTSPTPRRHLADDEWAARPQETLQVCAAAGSHVAAAERVHDDMVRYRKREMLFRAGGPDLVGQ